MQVGVTQKQNIWGSIEACSFEKVITAIRVLKLISIIGHISEGSKPLCTEMATESTFSRRNYTFYMKNGTARLSYEEGRAFAGILSRPWLWD